MTSDNKSKILQGIYEENLYHVVRGERRYKVDETRSYKYRMIGIATVAASIVLSIVIIGFSHKGDVALVRTAAATLPSGNQPINLAARPNLDRLLATAVPSLYNSSSYTHDELDFRPPMQLHVSPSQVEDFESLSKPGFSLVNLFGLGVKTIVIDPGHGGRDPGAISKNNVQEKEIVLSLAKRIKKRLMRRGGYKVFLTRDGDHSMSLQKRVQFANSKSADLFISIHVNAHAKVNGNFVETYYFGATEDSAVAELAALENAQSDYRYTDFKHMIQRISDTLKSQESKSLAAHVQNSLFRNVKKLNNKAADHGIKPGPFVVLLGLEVPSILTEVANLTDESEGKRLKTAEYRDNIAMFLEKGIVNYLNNSTTLGELR